MKLIMRGDDLGFSEAVNYGILKAVKDGVITSVGLMPNMEAAVHGFELLKDADIALGQHTNICVGKPVSDPKLIPSLVDESGEFCSSKEIRARQEDTIDIKECEIEIEAQLERFKEITGRIPDYFEGHAVFSKNFFSALDNVAKRHNLLHVNPMAPNWEEELGIHRVAMAEMDQDNMYDFKEYFDSKINEIKNNDCSLMVLHPGYLDHYILTHSSFTLVRPMECEFLCSDYIKDIIKENNIELVSFKNYRD